MENFQSINELLEYLSLKFKNNIAFKYYINKEITKKTYDEFVLDVNKVKKYAINNNIVNKQISVIGVNNYNWIVYVLGLICANNLVALVNNELDKEETAKLINKVETEYIFYDEECLDTIEEINTSKVEMVDISKINYNEIDTEVEVEVKSNKNCIILFTSGTTGNVKAAMLSHKALLIDAKVREGYFELTNDDSGLITVPLFHALGISSIISMLYRGSTLCICSNPRRINKVIRELQPSIIYTVPMIAKSLLTQIKGQDKTSIRLIIGSGATFGATLVKEYSKIGISLLEIYGSTENLIITTNYEGKYRDDSVGLVLPKYEVKIVNGEILTSSEQGFSGYYNDKDSTNEVIQDGWIKTGDIGYFDEDGYLFITGRKKNIIIKDDGNNISPEVLENKIYTLMPYVKEVMIYAENNTIISELYLGHQYSASEKKQVEDDIELINNKLPLYMKIDKVIIRNSEFIKTASNKIKRIK